MMPRLRFFVHSLIARYHDWRLGIYSEADILLDKFGVSDRSCHQYNASSYVRFAQLMKFVTIRPGEDVFLDVGSGMGRAVVLAATYPFRKVVGVELIEEFNAIARENVRKAKRRLVCRDVELVTTDAGAYRIPPEVNYIYFWNPFSGEILTRVFANIRASILETPRIVTILYTTPPEFTYLDDMKDQLPWLAVQHETMLGKKTRAVIYTCGPTV